MAEGVQRLNEGLLVVAPRRIVAVERGKRMVRISATSDTADANFLKHTWILTLTGMSWRTLQSIRLWKVAGLSCTCLKWSASDDLIRPDLRSYVPLLIERLHRDSVGGTCIFLVRDMSPENEEPGRWPQWSVGREVA